MDASYVHMLLVYAHTVQYGVDVVVGIILKLTGTEIEWGT